MWNELRYTLKVLVKNFKFSLLCVSVLAVGLGIVLPLYAWVDNLVMKSPPFIEGNRFVTVKRNLGQGTSQNKFDAFHYRFFKDNAQSFQSLNAWQNQLVTISDGEYAETYQSAALEPELLQLPGIQPLLGRLFSTDDVQTGAVPVAIISYDVWQNYYAARSDIVGHRGRINGETRTIVGVMPEGFAFPVSQHVWLPFATPATANAGEGPENLLVVGKLAAGTSMDEASSEMQLLETQIQAEWLEQYRHIESVDVVPYIRIATSVSIQGVVFLLFLASVIFLVTINIGNLFIVRGEERTVELAIRSALGATPARLGQSLMLESFVVCLCGMLLGLLFAHFGISYIDGSFASINPQLSDLFWWDMTLNGRMVMVSVIVVLIIWLASGGIPAWRLSRTNLSVLMAGSSKGLSDRSNSRLIKALVNLQLILGCAMMTMGIIQVVSLVGSRTNTIANAESLYTSMINFAATPLASSRDKQNYLDNLQQQLLVQLEVNEVAFTSAVPFVEVPTQAFTIEDQDLKVNDLYPALYVLTVSDNYLDVMDIGIVRGRGLNAADSDGSLPVVVVDKRLADQYWPGTSAIGKRIQVNPENGGRWMTIVGVSESSFMQRVLYADEAGTPIIYQPFRQTDFSQMRIVVKTQAATDEALLLIRKAVAGAHRDVPLNALVSLRQIEQRSAQAASFERNMYYTFIFIAVYLTGAATYGLAARAAGRRRVETGIRMALGASRAASLMVFLKDGFKTVVTGLGVGSVLTILLSLTVINSNPAKFNLVTILLPTMFVISLIMGSIVMLANYFPAKKIIAMEPGDALRHA